MKHSIGLFQSFDQIDNKLRELMLEFDIKVAAYAIVDHNEMVLANTLSIDNHIKVTATSLFQACSISKSVAAYAVLTLANQGIINLDIPINQQLREWKIPGKYADFITPRHCLNMTSGMTVGVKDSHITDYTQTMSLPTLRDILNGTSPSIYTPIRADHPVGEKYIYSGSGYLVIQQLIEEKTGQSFTDFMQKQLFTPLHMAHSTFACPLPAQQRAKAVPGFYIDGTPIENGWYNIPVGASGGLWTTPTDLAYFMQAICKMCTQQPACELLSKQKNSPFNLGFVIDGDKQNTSFRKIGYNKGYFNQLIVFPLLGKGIIVMTNSAASSELIKRFITYVAEAFHWPAFSNDFDEATTLRCK